MIAFLIRGRTRTTRQDFSDAGWAALVLTSICAILAGWLASSWVEEDTAFFLMLGTLLQLVFTLALASLKQQERRQ